MTFVPLIIFLSESVLWFRIFQRTYSDIFLGKIYMLQAKKCRWHWISITSPLKHGVIMQFHLLHVDLTYSCSQLLEKREQRKVLKIKILRMFPIYQRIPCLERTFNLHRVKGQTNPITTIIDCCNINSFCFQLSCFWTQIVGLLLNDPRALAAPALKMNWW